MFHWHMLDISFSAFLITICLLVGLLSHWSWFLKRLRYCFSCNDIPLSNDVFNTVYIEASSIIGNILLKLIAPYIPPSILWKSILFFIRRCLGFGDDKGMTYLWELVANKIPMNALECELFKLCSTGILESMLFLK